jgi:cell division initiation protein
MALSPQRIRDTHFKSVRKGYDPAEVDAFVEEVASALEGAQNDATAMEARARAAVARLQELSREGDTGGGTAPAPAAPAISAKVEEAETISRTLLLAQRTADTTIAEAQAEADRLLGSARDDASASLDAARAQAAQMVEDAKAEARKAGEGERVQVEGEVQALLARRDFLESDVDHLEQYLVAQRERLVEVVGTLNDLVQRVPGGLADMRRPLLSAAAEPEPEPGPGPETAAVLDDDDIAEAEIVEPSADGPADAGPDDEHDEIAEITRVASEGSRDATPASGSLFDEGPATQEMTAVNPRPSGTPER